MSYSVCYNCGGTVSGWEKYCGACVEEHDLENVPDWWKRFDHVPTARERAAALAEDRRRKPRLHEGPHVFWGRAAVRSLNAETGREEWVFACRLCLPAAIEADVLAESQNSAYEALGATERALAGGKIAGTHALDMEVLFSRWPFIIVTRRVK